MATLLGKPMVGHVHDRVASCQLVHTTAVATCDEEIAEYVTSSGGLAVMTSPTHERASDRCAEALRTLEEELEEDFDVVVMVQGDEPMTHPNMIAEALLPFYHDDSVEVANLLGSITSHAEFVDPNCIKVVCDQVGNALYLSRSPIPVAGYGSVSVGKQVCIIPFRKKFLYEYSVMEPTPLEIIESIDMLRVLEHGRDIRMVRTTYPSFAVDTPQDLLRVERIMTEGRNYV
jgi:3-deoxy-manno-octulosonate cytidylyltransferase (CMP-KDO synthetase)